jgi:hypothetical protein
MEHFGKTGCFSGDENNEIHHPYGLSRMIKHKDGPCMRITGRLYEEEKRT